MTDGLILGILLSLMLSAVGLKLRSMPIAFIGSLGWLISGLQVYQQTAEILPMALMIFVAFANFFLHVQGGEH